jgi:acyl-CoA thioester hydrolase/1,4-dihydroxy-2-naphthoyl-CoA hydrolase
MSNSNNEAVITPKLFSSKVKIHFRDADPAGIMFFGNLLGITHDVFEDFVAYNDISWDEWFRPTTWACPIRHSEVDFLRPFKPGNEYTVEVRVNKLSQSSFTMQYEFRSLEKTLCARVILIHTFVNQDNFQKIDIPDKFLNILNSYSV